jgi:hypothetical protein
MYARDFAVVSSRQFLQPNFVSISHLPVRARKTAHLVVGKTIPAVCGGLPKLWSSWCGVWWDIWLHQQCAATSKKLWNCRWNSTAMNGYSPSVGDTTADTVSALQTVQVADLCSRRQRAIEAWRDALCETRSAASACASSWLLVVMAICLFTHKQIVLWVWYFVPKALLQKCLFCYPRTVFRNADLEIQPNTLKGRESPIPSQPQISLH